MIDMLIKIAQAHEEGNQVITWEGLVGPLTAFLIITGAIIIARIIKK